jgi:hypothetical protein
MRQRGRKSAASLSVVSTSGIEVVKRPEPPEELTDEQSHEWRAIVNRMPAEWFPRETHGILAQYCRHVVAARMVAQLVERVQACETLDLDEYDKVLKLHEREGRALSSLATRMRLTQQASYTDKTPKGKGGIKRPWDVDGDE